MPLFLGGVIGYLSWGHYLTLTILSLSLFLSYLLMEKRSHLLLFALGYYLLASRGLLLGVEHYYHHLGYALLIWGVAALLSSLAWILIWSPSFTKRRYLFPLALLLTILPPLGFISWVNPLPTIALLLPDLGFFALFIEIGVLYLLAIVGRRYTKCHYCLGAMVTLPLALLLMIHFVIAPHVKVNPTLESIQSNIEYYPLTFDKSKEYQRIKTFFYSVQEGQNLNTLLPENALGNYSAVQSMVWEDLDKNRTVFAGATMYNSRYTKNRNVLLQIEYNSTKILYQQRVPVLIAMWRPFTHRGTEATLYQQPVVAFKGARAGIFICYEQLLTYPYLQTFFYKPKMLIGVSNLYWAKGTNIKAIQKETMELWAILFGVPLSFSVNG